MGLGWSKTQAWVWGMASGQPWLLLEGLRDPGASLGSTPSEENWAEHELVHGGNLTPGNFWWTGGQDPPDEGEGVVLER